MARTQLCFGQRLRRRKNRALARRQLTAAWQTFDALGADAWTRVAHTELTAIGARLQPRPRTGADVLTPQELQVASLAASGAGNQEVAERLFISRKTVEYHLGHVYRKLALASRTELAAALTTIPPRLSG
jgi:DNA-binding CsgD family transcriptional regulator